MAENDNSFYTFGETGRESAEAVFSTNAADRVALDSGAGADVATVEDAVRAVESASSETSMRAGVDAAVVSQAKDAIARARQPGGSPTAATDVNNIRNAALTEKGKVDAEQVKELQQSFAIGAGAVAGAAAVAGGAANPAYMEELNTIKGSLSSTFTSIAAKSPNGGMGSLGTWRQDDYANLGNVELNNQIPGQGPAQGQGTYRD